MLDISNLPYNGNVGTNLTDTHTPAYIQNASEIPYETPAMEE